LVENNFVHRDIKPGNILVTNGVLKIADFGESYKIYEKTEKMSEFVGTISTAAPQIRFH
jgi:serine/threonine protein kinase